MTERKKGVTLPNANRLSHGFLFTKGNTMKLDARNGAAKRLTNPAITHGMTRQSKPSHEFAHGAPLDTEPLQKNWEGKGNVPDSFDMRRQTKGEPLSGTDVLTAASRLGRSK